MKIQSSLSLVLGVAALVLATAPSARAQNEPRARYVGYDFNAGLIGQNYTSGEFTYIRRADDSPRTMHRYSLVATALIPEIHNTDGAFRYNYTRGGSGGSMAHRHDAAVSLTHFLPVGDMKPFIRGDLGWSWMKVGGAYERSILYVAGVGTELLLAPRFAATPYVNYQYAPALNDRFWTFGTKLTARLNRDWHGTFGFAYEDTRNLNFTLAAQRRF